MKCYPSGALLGLLVFMVDNKKKKKRKKHVIYSSFIELHPG